MSAETGSIPPMRSPMTYVIDYSGRFLEDPANIDAFTDAPPDLMHVGRTVPITHNWGPVAVLWGENQYTGRPRGENSRGVWREGIRLLSPDELHDRIEMLKEYTSRWHKTGIRWLVPYSAINTIAGDNETREGFWEFYDRWDEYAEWLGPRPAEDPVDWLMRGRDGGMIQGACGGSSPAYYAPLHRYRTCTEHPDWMSFQRRLTQMIAEVGYDGVFPDNSSIHNVCFCERCAESFRDYVGAMPDRELAILGASRDAGLLDERTPGELIRRFRIEQVARYQRDIRDAGRTVDPDFIVFPNGNCFESFMRVCDMSDVLMFESTHMSGCILDQPPAGDSEIFVEVVDGQAKDSPPLNFYLGLSDVDIRAMFGADVTGPSRLSVGDTARFDLRIDSYGRPFHPTQRSQDFRLIFIAEDGSEESAPFSPELKLSRELHGERASFEPVNASVEWTPRAPGRYRIAVAFSHQSDGDVEGERRPVSGEVRGETCWPAHYQTHIGQMFFTMNAAARTVSLNYGTRDKEDMAPVAELELAECAAFSSGSTVTAYGTPLNKYASFFRKTGHLYDGYLPFADIGLLYAYWGNNPDKLLIGGMDPRPTPSMILASQRRLIKVLCDRMINEADCRSLRTLILCGQALEMSDTQVDALKRFADSGGALMSFGKDITLNGAGIREILGDVPLWNMNSDDPGMPPLIDSAYGPMRGLRFSAFVHPAEPRMTLHALNYNVTFHGGRSRVTPVEGAIVHLPLAEGLKVGRVSIYDPDNAAISEPFYNQEGGMLKINLPTVRIYKLIEIDGS